MDENQLELLLEIIEDAGNPAGLDLESLEQVIANEGIGVLYGLMPEGAVESADELANLFPDLKKKTSPTKIKMVLNSLLQIRHPLQSRGKKDLSRLLVQTL